MLVLKTPFSETTEAAWPSLASKHPGFPPKGLNALMQTFLLKQLIHDIVAIKKFKNTHTGNCLPYIEEFAAASHKYISKPDRKRTTQVSFTFWLTVPGPWRPDTNNHLRNNGNHHASYPLSFLSLFGQKPHFKENECVCAWFISLRWCKGSSWTF